VTYDNALAESVNALYKKEVIHRNGQWNTVAEVTLATAEWVTGTIMSGFTRGAGTFPRWSTSSPTGKPRLRRRDGRPVEGTASTKAGAVQLADGGIAVAVTPGVPARANQRTAVLP
jgi:hypothetical protein